MHYNFFSISLMEITKIFCVDYFLGPTNMPDMNFAGATFQDPVNFVVMNTTNIADCTNFAVGDNTRFNVNQWTLKFKLIKWKQFFTLFFLSLGAYSFGRLQNPVLMVLSSKSSRFRRPSKPSASWAWRLRRLWKDSRSDVFFFGDNLAWEPRF